MEIGFAEIDFQQVESAGMINVTLSARGEAPTDLILVIRPFTFEEYRMQFGRRLPPEIQIRAEGVDRAECEFYHSWHIYSPFNSGLIHCH